MKTYTAALIGCSRMGAFIDNEVRGRGSVLKPYSHAAGYTACDRTDLIACADLRTDVMERFGEAYGVPKERQYTDFREMIDTEKPEVVSVATQPEQRAEIVIYAAEHGARAIYAEKAMAASISQADAMVEACDRNGVAFNLGTNRRWDPGYDAMKSVIDSGDLGPLKALLLYSTSSLFNTASHGFDLIMRLNNDSRGVSVQGRLLDDEPFKADGTIGVDPVGEGTVMFENGVVCYAMNTGHASRYDAVCEDGIVSARYDGRGYQVLRGDPSGSSPAFVEGEFPEFEMESSTLLLIEDLVHSLDTGEPPRGGAHNARASTELIFGIIESHRRGGARVELPLEERTTRMAREIAPRQPRFEPRS